MPSLLIDRERNIMAANEAAVSLLGLDPVALGVLGPELPGDAEPSPRPVAFTGPRGGVASVVLASRPVEGGGAMLMLADITAERRENADLAERGKMMASMLADFPGMAYRCKLDANWTMEYVTAGCLDLIGYAPSDLLGNSVIAYGEVIVPEDREMVTAAVRGGAERRGTYTVTYRVLTKSGERRWVWERGRPVVSPSGEVISIEGYITDITESKRTEDALKESERKVSSMMSNLPGMVFRCKNDRDYTMNFISDGCVDICGYPASSLIASKGLSFGSLMLPEDADRVWKEIQDGLRTSNLYRTTYRIRTDSGEVRTVWEQGRGVLKGRELVAVEGFISDITATARVDDYTRVEVDRLAGNLIKLAEGKLDLNMIVSKGDRYTEAARENFKLINASLGRAVEAIASLARDVNALSAAAVEGKLSTRADMGKHRGEYRTIVQGINATLDAVIAPINDAIGVAGSYAEGDLSSRMGVEAQGDLGRLARSLDMIGESLARLVGQVNRSVGMVSSTSQELASSAEEMSASTEQVSTAIQHISRGSQDQAAQVEAAARLMAEMATSTDTAAARSALAVEAAKKADASAASGRNVVLGTVEKMQEIQRVVESSAKVIEGLGKRSEEIGEIVGVITRISDQTNMLSLNAAIEAARAGDQGRGFSVVAEEVKNLAEDSMEAAERIAGMIKEVQKETSRAVASMRRGTSEVVEGMVMVDQTGKAFQEISSLSAETVKEIVTISSLMHAQKHSSLKVATSVDGIATIAEETASAAEESASSTEELTTSMEDLTARAQALSEMALELQQVAARFRTERHAKAASAKKAPVRTRQA